MASLRKAVRRATPSAATTKPVRIGGSVGSSVTPGGSVVATGFPEGMKSSPMPSSHYTKRMVRKAIRRSTNY